jgi:hypothetical protein
MKKVIILITILMINVSSNLFSNEILVKEIADKVSKENIEQLIKDLTGLNPVNVEGEEVVFVNRYYKSELNILVAKYIKSKLLEYDYETHFVSVTPNGWNGSLETVYAIKKGTISPDKVVLFSSSFETPTPKNSNINDTMPGANYNASGIAIMLEAARLLENYENEKTIIFAAFDGCFDTGYGPFHLIDSLENVELSSKEYIFLTNLGRELELGSSTIASSDTTNSRSIIDSFLDVDNILKLNTGLKNIVQKITLLYVPTKIIPEISFMNTATVNDPLLFKPNDKFETLDLDYLNDNSKLAISSLALLSHVKPTTSVNNRSENENILYPNPTGDFIIINLSNKGLQSLEAVEQVQIFDILGIEVMSDSIHPMTSSHLMNVEKLPAGVYFIKVGNQVKKFVKL